MSTLLDPATLGKLYATWRPATYEKETIAQVFSCENCEIFKKTYFEEHLSMIACLYCP